jgi:hypothetical protein
MPSDGRSASPSNEPFLGVLAVGRHTIREMGLEAECTVQVGRKSSTGRALLETEALIFRGDFSLQIPFASMREVTVDGGALVVKGDQEARFELGAPVAERWLRMIKEPKSLFEKLELGPESRVAVVDVPEGFLVVFFGAESRDALRKIQLLRARMLDSGVLWIVRPKGSKDISEADVFEAAHGAGLVDTKVVAFSKTHTAHKCVIPVDQRGVMRRRPPVMTIPPSAPLLQPKRAARPSVSKAPARPASKPTKPVKAVKTAKPAKARKPPKAAKARKPSKPAKPASKKAAKKHK